MKVAAKIVFVAAAFAATLRPADAVFGTLSAAAAGTGLAGSFTALGAATTTTAFLTPVGVVAAGGAALLAKIAALEILRNAQRNKRAAERFMSEDEVDAQIAMLSHEEPQHCYRRYVCDLAAGNVVSQSTDAILALFKNEVPVESPRFDFRTAAKVGSLEAATSQPLCQRRFSCVFSGQQIADMLN